eukprot:2624271-Rhodomonas_salina.1
MVVDITCSLCIRFTQLIQLLHTTITIADKEIQQGYDEIGEADSRTRERVKGRNMDANTEYFHAVNSIPKEQEPCIRCNDRVKGVCPLIQRNSQGEDCTLLVCWKCGNERAISFPRRQGCHFRNQLRGCSLPHEDCLWNKTISREELQLRVSTLPKRKAAGPDGITYEVLAALPPVALQILTNCINGLLQGGNWGDSSKLAYVRLLPKSDEVEKLEKLRPICLMSA